MKPNEQMEKYSSGWRGAPAKGIDGLRRARVQIPPSPFDEKLLKKVVDIEKNLWYDNKVACDGVKKERKKLFEKKLKKFLTKSKQHDKISKLSETATDIDNWTVKHIPRKFFLKS